MKEKPLLDVNRNDNGVKVIAIKPIVVNTDNYLYFVPIGTKGKIVRMSLEGVIVQWKVGFRGDKPSKEEMEAMGIEAKDHICNNEMIISKMVLDSPWNSVSVSKA